ncbi:MAG: beta-lactamase family protein, partial [Treponema sp.]|nr:beta-lactamase family protein [Treponema sp.]
MKKALILSAMAGIASALSAQSLGTGTLDAKASDPNVMGWMQGFPPAADRTVSAADGSFFNFPALRFSVCHMREFNLTRDVPARKEKYFEFKTKINPGIEGITFTPWDEDKPIGWQEFLDRNYTDGIIIVHKGKIVYEKYMGALKEDGVHAAMSVSKSFAGTVGAILVAQGRLDDTKPATEYVPELKGSGFDGATVREVMDMTTAIDYSEDYNDPNAGVWQFSAAGNPFRPANYSGPKSYYEYIPTVKGIAGQKQGEKFGYRTVNT